MIFLIFWIAFFFLIFKCECLADNVELFTLNSEKSIGAFAGVDVIIRSYCSSSGMKKFDFTDLT